MKKPVVLVSGPKESGKDSFGKFLVKWLEEGLCRRVHQKTLQPKSSSTNVPQAPAFENPVVVRFAFADPIKRAIGDALGIPDEVLWGNSEIKEKTIVYGKSVRHWLQVYGTEWFRDSVCAEIWVDKALRAITAEQCDRYVNSDANGFVICDCRFGNEYSQMRDVLEFRSKSIPTGEYGKKRWAEQDAYVMFLYRVWRNERPTAAVADQHRSENSFHELDAFNPVHIDNSGTFEHLEAIAQTEAERIVQLL